MSNVKAVKVGDEVIIKSIVAKTTKDFPEVKFTERFFSCPARIATTTEGRCIFFNKEAGTSDKMEITGRIIKINKDSVNVCIKGSAYCFDFSEILEVNGEKVLEGCRFLLNLENEGEKVAELVNNLPDHRIIETRAEFLRHVGEERKDYVNIYFLVEGVSGEICFEILFNKVTYQETEFLGAREEFMKMIEGKFERYKSLILIEKLKSLAQ